MSGGAGALAGDFKELATLKGQTCTGEVGAWAVHLIFFGGFSCYSWAISTLGLALGFEPALALAPGFLAWYGCFIYMKIAKQSLMGFPGFSGVPTPLFELFAIASLSLLANLVTKFLAGEIPIAFYIVLVVGVAIPQLIGIKVRKSDWRFVAPS